MYRKVKNIKEFRSLLLASLSSQELSIVGSCVKRVCGSLQVGVDYEQSLLFLSLSNIEQNVRECTRARLKARDGTGTKKERLPAQQQRMVFYGLLIF